MDDDQALAVPAPSPDGRTDPKPFVIAVALFAALMILAAVFLRGDDRGELVRPVSFERLGDDTFLATAYGGDQCRRIERAQVDLGIDTVYVEFVVVDADTCRTGPAPFSAVITLPEPLDRRRLIGGVGRLQLPCVADGPDYRCGPAR